MLVSIIHADQIWNFDLSIDLPMVSTNHSNLLVSPGDDIDLTCTVEGQVSPDIRWFKGTQPVLAVRSVELQ